jgi:hypothetical protein
MTMYEEWERVKESVDQLLGAILCSVAIHDYIIPLGYSRDEAPYCSRCNHKLWRKDDKGCTP